MTADEYKKDLLKEIEKEQMKINQLDTQGNLWWSTFRKFVREFDPVPRAEPIDFVALLELINKTFGREFRVVSSNVKSKYRARMKDGYTKEDLFRAIMAVKKNDFHIENDFQYCTPTFFSQEKTLEKYGTLKIKDDGKINDDSPVN